MRLPYVLPLGITPVIWQSFRRLTSVLNGKCFPRDRLMSLDTSDTEGGGNTCTPPSKKPRAIRGRRWCFTLNNYTLREYNDVCEWLTQNAQSFIVGQEKGDQGTDHLQGYLEFKNARSFNVLKDNLPRAHIEKAKSGRESNCAYCRKEGRFVSNFPDDLVAEEYQNVEWRPWQAFILDELRKRATARRIVWVVDEEGATGK